MAKAKEKINVGRLGFYDPDIKGINQFERYPSVGSPHDAEVTGSGFTKDFIPNVYMDYKGAKLKIGEVIDKTYQDSETIYFTLSLYECATIGEGDDQIFVEIPPGDDKIVGIECKDFGEVFSDPDNNPKVKYRTA